MWGRTEAKNPVSVLTSHMAMDKNWLSLSFPVNKMSDWPTSVTFTLSLVAPEVPQRASEGRPAPYKSIPAKRMHHLLFCDLHRSQRGILFDTHFL